MTALPSNLALTQILTDAQVLSADHRTNYAAIQTAVNQLIAALSGGTNGQFLQALDGTDVAYAAAPVPASGWSSIAATLTWSSVDGHTSVVTTSVDLTGVIPVGARIKVTNNATTMYFIVTAIAAGSITLYGGTDFVLANSAITNPFYSLMKAPFGFNANPDKWTETATDIGQRSQATPVQHTWYNLDVSHQLAVPIGSWQLSYSCQGGSVSNAAGGSCEHWLTLSTGNNTESDKDFTAANFLQISSASNDWETHVGRAKNVLLAAKTTYFLNISTQDVTNLTSLKISGGSEKLIIRAVCAYL